MNLVHCKQELRKKLLVLDTSINRAELHANRHCTASPGVGLSAPTCIIARLQKAGKVLALFLRDGLCRVDLCARQNTRVTDIGYVLVR